MPDTGIDPWVFDRRLRRQVDLYYVVLLASAEQTLLPELYETIGPDKIMDVLEKFAGTTVQIPSPAVIRNAARDVTIYVDVTGGVGEDVVARRAGLSVDEVRAIVTRVGELARGCT